MSFGPHPAARAADEISQRLDHHHQLVDRLGHRQDPEAVQTQQRLRQPVTVAHRQGFLSVVPSTAATVAGPLTAYADGQDSASQTHPPHFNA